MDTPHSSSAPSSPDGGQAPRHRHSAGTDPISRRRFLGWTAAGGVVAATVAFFIGEDHEGGTPKAASAPKPPAKSTTTTGPRAATQAAHEAEVQGVPLQVSPAIVAENARQGDAWWVTTPQAAGDIEGYSDKVSVVAGDTVTLRVNTKATSFHVEAYRMGYYQGIGARKVWTSATVPGVRQAPPALVAPTNTIECSWTPSLTFTPDHTWPPGAYLLKLVGASSEQGFVPLCVRDDTSHAAVVIQQSVTTWQAYNLWGGYSLYYGNAGGAVTYTQSPGSGTYEHRARIVSFDRPYNHDWASGASDFVGNELPVIFQAEQLGLDVTYWTDVDLHERPQLLAKHRALLSLGHDEYWSSPMRTAVETGITRGLNVAFLGANACYRQIRLEQSALGADRHVVCYKSAAEDPLHGTDNALVTVNWEDPPVSLPESRMTGAMYQDIGADADIEVLDQSSWVLAGTGLTSGQKLPKALQGEFDRFVPGGVTPTNVDIITHSVVPNRHGNYSDMTWYTVAGGGGVLDMANASWVGQMADAPLIPSNVLQAAVPGVTEHLNRMMLNVYSVLGASPASTTHPSTGNWRSAYQ